MSDKDNEHQHYPWNEGMPTKPDVDLLLKTWPDPQIGDRFNYDVVVTLLGIDQVSTRFKTVTNSWRKRLLEKGTVIECIPGEAFYAASANQVSASTYTRLQTIGRIARKHRRKLGVVKTETDEERNVITHQGRLLHEVERQSKKSRMNLLPSTATPQLPKIEPQKENE